MAADSSDHAWAGMDLTGGQILQEFWRTQRGLHINVKELLAAMQTVRSLAKPKETVFLLVDNSTSFWYLKKQGGRLGLFNDLLRPFLLWCLQNEIKLDVQLVKSSEMPADHLSRPPLDHGDYTLNPTLFQQMWKLFRPHFPQGKCIVDMFASPGNAKFPLFISRHPHWEALGMDALNMALDNIHVCYCNPPWSVISQWLARLLQNPHLLCWMVVPYWGSTSWFPLLRKLVIPKTPVWVVPPFHGMFQNCVGELMKAPRWPLLFCLLSGRCFKGNKFRLNPKTFIWPE